MLNFAGYFRVLCSFFLSTDYPEEHSRPRPQRLSSCAPRPHANSKESPDVKRKWPGYGRQAHFQCGAGPPAPGSCLHSKADRPTELGGKCALAFENRRGWQGPTGYREACAKGKSKSKERFLSTRRPQTFDSSLSNSFSDS